MKSVVISPPNLDTICDDLYVMLEAGFQCVPLHWEFRNKNGSQTTLPSLSGLHSGLYLIIIDHSSISNSRVLL